MSESSEKEKELKSESWEKGLIEKVAMSAIIEQRRSRRWGIFFKFLFFGYLILPKVCGQSACRSASDRHW